MKTYIGVFALLVAITGCGQNENGGARAHRTLSVDKSSVAVTSDTLCFERYTGGRNQDTASITLVLNGSMVTGKYANIPYEKDARLGTISGRRSGNVIRGVWRFQQEGMNDSLAFEFKLGDENLSQKPTSFDPKTGRETLADTASFNLKYTKVDCRAVNTRIK